MARSGRPGRARESSGSSRKHRHLGRRTDLAILVSYREELNAIAEARRDIGGPALELGAAPFEPVIQVPKLSRRQRWPLHVVFGVRRRQGNRAGARRLE